ncbi:MAG: hypothetical protein JSV04_04115, partial [Candidatus Heimdallarchaeota archaeon]
MMKRNGKLAIKIVVFLFIMNLIINSQNHTTALIQNDIPIEEEYTSGIISKEYSNLSYVWVHAN